MRVLDPKRIQKLMVIKGISQRQLAGILGWESHSYLGRILRGDIKSVQPAVAARIAEYLEVGMDDLFVPRTTSNTAQIAKRKRAA
jgi:transcriptional regulator with XRE-family HTH domain